jgi:hypothetical protein
LKDAVALSTSRTTVTHLAKVLLTGLQISVPAESGGGRRVRADGHRAPVDSARIRSDGLDLKKGVSLPHRSTAPFVGLSARSSASSAFGHRRQRTADLTSVSIGISEALVETALRLVCDPGGVVTTI